MPFNPARYASMAYRRCGRSGLQLPALSFGLWQGPGSYVDDAASRRIVHTAFDHGITHFDLANNYGHPPGASEELLGRIVRDMPRQELVISSKAGFSMWDGPYGEGGSRKMVKAVLESLTGVNSVCAVETTPGLVRRRSRRSRPTANSCSFGKWACRKSTRTDVIPSARKPASTASSFCRLRAKSSAPISRTSERET